MEVDFQTLLTLSFAVYLFESVNYEIITIPLNSKATNALSGSSVNH